MPNKKKGGPRRPNPLKPRAKRRPITEDQEPYGLGDFAARVLGRIIDQFFPHRPPGPYPRDPFQPNPVTLTPDEVQLLKEVLRAGYRKLAAEWHPEAQGGGDVDKFKRLSQLKEKMEIR